MTIELSRRGFCIGTALIGLQAISSGAFERTEEGTVKLGLVAPMSGPNARYGAFSLRGAQIGPLVSSLKMIRPPHTELSCWTIFAEAAPRLLSLAHS
ncbi:hypothetical protein ACVWW6_006786 [Bradyrhizobium sp. USDA 3311]|jgi:hypothetical protein|uniref:hypothetical protein n=1 Tax=Bradyrhizobium diazoefficiens TaxID=1355477 RepID=UPI00272CE321|nr:hypothetical protein [Bradyrhizobium diazoefficiens]WLA62638.1 hypothetical protein QNN01_29845 [Bradyrhizobium diazoefficiens]